MAGERWSVLDSAVYKLRREEADRRLEAWARWSGFNSTGCGGYASTSQVIAALSGPSEEGQAGARHVAPECTDEEALEVDGILGHWQDTDPGYLKIVRQEYLRYGPQEMKAAALGINRTEYGRKLEALQLEMWRELQRAAVRRRE